ncbi:MAG: hypothetical protein ACRDWT_06290 [Jatrophihabitantaceae bacterium]
MSWLRRRQQARDLLARGPVPTCEPPTDPNAMVVVLGRDGQPVMDADGDPVLVPAVPVPPIGPPELQPVEPPRAGTTRIRKRPGLVGRRIGWVRTVEYEVADSEVRGWGDQ